MTDLPLLANAVSQGQRRVGAHLPGIDECSSIQTQRRHTRADGSDLETMIADVSASMSRKVIGF